MLLALFDSPAKVGAVLLLYLAIQQIERNLVTPIIMKKQVSLLPAYTLALLAAFGTILVFFRIIASAANFNYCSNFGARSFNQRYTKSLGKFSIRETPSTLGLLNRIRSIECLRSVFATRDRDRIEHPLFCFGNFPTTFSNATALS